MIVSYQHVMSWIYNLGGGAPLYYETQSKLGGQWLSCPSPPINSEPCLAFLSLYTLGDEVTFTGEGVFLYRQVICIWKEDLPPPPRH